MIWIMLSQTSLVIFDLDGVLIDSKGIHYKALNIALKRVDSKYEISEDEHLAKFDGLSTMKKLELLYLEKGLPKDTFDLIWSHKQKITIKLFDEIESDQELISFMKYFREKGIKLAVASNSIKATVDKVLSKLSIIDFFDSVMSNEDVTNSKPHPEIYWKTMSLLGCYPENVVILEDSNIGRIAAQRSGAQLMPIDNRSDLTWSKIQQIEFYSTKLKTMSFPWKSNSLNVLIPMAGAGSRFEKAGYSFPKPLIEVLGKPMIQLVVENLNIEAKYIYIVQKSHNKKYNLEYLLQLITPNCEIIQVEGLTEGAACTTLLARDLIDNDQSLLIANSDQYVEWNSSETLYSFMTEGIDGGIVTFNATHPKWSYVKTNLNGFAEEVAEKKPISNTATVGIYYWKKGSDYVKYADQMINKNIRTNGEFYVCPVFNEAIQDNKKFKTKNIEKMWGLGTPEDLNYFLEYHKW
jgi:beta-phosphoglucomutase-like phosphatase (HAD superfamily)/dTDP-glucose pyrophosphorylase